MSNDNSRQYSIRELQMIGAAREEFRKHQEHVKKLYANIYRIVMSTTGYVVPADFTPLDAVQLLADYARSIRGAATPFVRISKGIPENWNGNQVLTFEELPNGHIRLNTLAEYDNPVEPTIDDWRNLAKACQGEPKEQT